MIFSMLLASTLLFSIIIVSIPYASGSDMDENLNKSVTRQYNDTNSITSGSKKFSNLSDSSELNLDKNKGILIVKSITINGDKGMNKSSDFTISVHANNPVPTTFKGNSSGTIVELPMGMYSVTTSSITNYNTALSSDCSGGIMEVETIICSITNSYINTQ